MPAHELSNVEKSLGQILLHLGIVKESDMEAHMNKLRVDFPDDAPLALADMFKRMNVSMKAMGLQIRSLVSQEHVEDGEDESDMEEGVAEDKIIMVRYHGIVNEEADVTAEKFGTTLKPEELVFFKDCVERLVLNKYQSLHDLVYLSEHAKACRSGWKADMEMLVERLIENRWLQRTDKAYVELGPRSYLELRDLIETTTLLSLDEEGVHRTEAEREALRKELLAELPQIMYY